MALPLKGITDLAGLDAWLDRHCESAGHSCWHHYGPSDLLLYEAQKPRVMLVNSESGGYDGCGSIPADVYLTWIKDRWSTPRYGAVLVTAIRRYTLEMREGRSPVEFDRPLFSNTYNNTDALIENMRATIYMNARVTSNASDSRHEQKSDVM